MSRRAATARAISSSNGTLCFPADTRVGDALPVNEFFSGNEILTAAFQIAFDHGAHNPGVAARDLAADLPADFDLAQVIFLAVGMTQVDHNALREPRRCEFLACGIDAAGVVVRLAAAAQDDMTIFVTHGRDDGGVSFLGDRKEMMRMLRGPDRINGNFQIAVGSILESDRTRQT